MPLEAAKEMLRKGAKRVKRASDEILEPAAAAFEERVQDDNRRAQEQDDEDERRSANAKREAGNAYERLKNITKGEKPTRESTEEYTRRKGEEDERQAQPRSPYRNKGSAGIRG